MLPLLAASAAVAEEPRAKNARKKVLAPEDVQSWVAEMRPDVECVAERAFRACPQVRLIDAHELHCLIAERVEQQLACWPTNAIPAWFGPDPELVVDHLAAHVYGAYRPEADEIIFSRENVERLLKESANYEPSGLNVAKLVGAHLLVLAMQNQELGYAQLREELCEAYSIEHPSYLLDTHASFVRRQVADQRAWQSSSSSYWRESEVTITLSPLCAIHADPEMKPTEMEWFALRAYAGAQAESGMDAVWQLLNSAGGYRSGVEAPPIPDPRDEDLLAAIEHLHGNVAQTWQDVRTGACAPEEARTRYNALSEIRLTELVQSIERATWSRAVNRSGDRPVQFESVVVIAKPKRAAHAYGLIIDAAELQYRRPDFTWDGGGRRTYVINPNLNVSFSNRGAYLTYETNRMNVQTVVAVRDPYIIHLTATNCGLSEQRLESLAGSALFRLNNLERRRAEEGSR